jgi:hypothetical protein
MPRIEGDQYLTCLGIVVSNKGNVGRINLATQMKANEVEILIKLVHLDIDSCVHEENSQFFDSYLFTLADLSPESLEFLLYRYKKESLIDSVEDILERMISNDLIAFYDEKTYVVTRYGMSLIEKIQNQ